MTSNETLVLPQSVRNAARTLVRAQPGFSEWRERQGMSGKAALRKAEILQAARDLGIWEQLVALAGTVPMDKESDNEDEDMVSEAVKMDIVSTATVDPVTAAIDNVLDPVRPFLAGSMLAEIERRVRPLAIEANRPPQIVAVAPAGTVPYARIVRQATMSTVFAVRGAQSRLPVAVWDASDAPRPEPAYVVEPARFAEVATALEHGETVWLAGGAGTGKGTLAREYAARTGRPFTRIGFTRSTEIVDLLGQSEPVPHANGGVEMVWRDKVFTQSIRRPGTVILLDELMIAPAGTVAVFQTILDEKRVTLPTGEVVAFAPGVVVIIADNSAGYGDESGVYAGVQSANAALVDRCGRLVVIGYLPAKLEALALAKHTGAPHAACQRLADFAKAVRTAAAKSGGEARPFSFRRLVAFMSAVHRDMLAVDTAWNVTALSRLPEGDRETLRQAIRAHFDGDAFQREVSGAVADMAPVDAAPLSQSAEQVDARRVFSA